MHEHEFREGDVFYTFYGEEYRVYKLLKTDEAGETFHVLCYAPLKQAPTLSDLQDLQVSIYHVPIHRESFHDTTFLLNVPVTEDELIGFYEYERQTEADFEDAIRIATAHYKTAYDLTDEGKIDEAIEQYSAAINLIPTFYEAIDNRAFCKMDQGRWRDAIEDFQLSLQVHPDSLLAEFSIGECYYRLGEFAKARDQFEKCTKIDPSHELSQEFLVRSSEMMFKEN